MSLDGEWALLDWFLRKSWGDAYEHGSGSCLAGYLVPVGVAEFVKNDEVSAGFKTRMVLGGAETSSTSSS